MKKFLYSLLCMVVATIASACGGDSGAGEESATGGSVAIGGITVNYTEATIKIKTTDIEEYAYVVALATDVVERTAEQLFAEGTVGQTSGQSSVTFKVTSLTQNTKYNIQVAGRKGKHYTEVAKLDFTTKKRPDVTIVQKTADGFTAQYYHPTSVASTSVVKYAVVDMAQFNEGGGDGTEEEWLNRNEAIYNNLLTADARLTFNEASRTFEVGGVTYAHHDPITYGQPSYLLLGEYGEGAHSEWGEGHYTPLYGAGKKGFKSKTLVVGTRPTTLAAEPQISVRVSPSGKGSILITPTADIKRLYYMVVEESQYNEIISRLFLGDNSHLQWFVGSAAAERLYGATKAEGAATIDASRLNLRADAQYHLMVASWGDNAGSTQSYKEVTFSLPAAAPEVANNIVVAHRGGSTEAGKTTTPDNSIASLRYAQRLRCYASETDIYWTKDNQIIVAHADGNIKINGRYPWEYTLAELQASGKLSNGETLPTLEEYLRETMKKGSCTKLWLDLKNCYLSSSNPHHDKVVKACKRACEIIAEMEATPWVEFICTGYEEPLAESLAAAKAIGVPFAWMANKYPATYVSKGVDWANMSLDYIKDGINDTNKTIHTIDSFVDKGIKFSVYTVDDEAHMNYYVGQKGKLKAITTNYPAKLINKF